MISRNEIYSVLVRSCSWIEKLRATNQNRLRYSIMLVKPKDVQLYQSGTTKLIMGEMKENKVHEP